MKSLFDLKENDCRYILKGSGMKAQFCAEPVKPGESWCLGHCKVVFKEVAVSKRRKRDSLALPIDRVDIGPVEPEHAEDAAAHVPDLIQILAA